MFHRTSMNNYLLTISLYVILLNPVNNALNVESNDCHRCKFLTDSFVYWLDRTSRGKFEGGDTAWEEAKLKSYSRSEIRLVEIQESLCSELKKGQNQCYALNEEVEQILETWWSLENSTFIDLYTWLCIEQLKYCCPKNHYGELCEPCPSINNKICNGHGLCFGEGIREGNGTCICADGYKGINCDECDHNFFLVNRDSCQPCHKACNGCNSDGLLGCIECAVGWTMDSGICRDINECDNLSVCKNHQFCINKEGSYKCLPCHKTCKTCDGIGYSNCSSCDTDKVLLAGQCITTDQLQQTLFSVLLRLFLYLILIFSNILVFKKSKPMAALVVIGIAIFIYCLEEKFDINTKHVISSYSNTFNS